MTIGNTLNEVGLVRPRRKQAPGINPTERVNLESIALSSGVRRWNMQEQRTSPLSDIANHKKKRLLMVVDSDTHNLAYTAALLKRLDYPIDTAKTAREAIDRATVMVPSLIITALELEDMRGLDFARSLKKNPGLAAVPFITLRRQGDLQGEKQSLELGACECLYSPVAPERLYLAIQTATEIKPRKNIRLKTNIPVKVDSSPGDGLRYSCTSDLSERGMFLHSAEPAPEKTRLSLQVNIECYQIPVEASVVYSYRTSGGKSFLPGMGLEFNGIASGDREIIRRFVRDEITRDIAPGNA
jgi:CheY-like chemotaxis protein